MFASQRSDTKTGPTVRVQLTSLGWTHPLPVKYCWLGGSLDFVSDIQNPEHIPRDTSRFKDFIIKRQPKMTSIVPVARRSWEAGRAYCWSHRCLCRGYASHLVTSIFRSVRLLATPRSQPVPFVAVHVLHGCFTGQAPFTHAYKYIDLQRYSWVAREGLW